MPQQDYCNGTGTHLSNVTEASICELSFTRAGFPVTEQHYALWGGAGLKLAKAV